MDGLGTFVPFPIWNDLWESIPEKFGPVTLLPESFSVETQGVISWVFKSGYFDKETTHKQITWAPLDDNS